MPQIIQMLEERGVSAERKSLYADIETLRDFGLDIRKYQRRPVEYALAEREFELPEITLLIDAVQSSRFLSEGSAKALVKSLRNMASRAERPLLDKRVHVYGRPRQQRFSDFALVDQIQEAMAAKRQISFRYFRYDVNVKRVPTREGSDYVVTPVNLTYSDGNYYLVAYSHADQEIRNYRVDRMDHIEMLPDKAVRNEMISAYDPDEVSSCVFGMYDGERVMATLWVDERVMNVIVDRFGRGVKAVPVEGGSAARVTVHVNASPVFFGWLAQMGTSIRIEGPAALREEYAQFIRDIAAQYE